MAWEHLDVNRPHLVYIILGAFTSLFMLCSSVIKERLYIGEATVATIVGIIFGPHAANLINPLEWGNTDQITLEFCRIVLVVQCFAVGVELPRSYMEKHWKSVTFLLVPVMTFGWLVTSLFIWWMFFGKLSWLDSLCCAACVTATDPVLASSVVGKGKFAKRVPKHLRDLLSAESGCNDGMAFPFIYLAIYLIRYRPDASAVSFHWFCYTILYECIFGAVYGVCVGYAARRAIRYAHEKDLIDRESFLVFYFVLALFCAGSGSILGMDDLLIGFACGVGFSNDGWFQEKTEEAHVSNVIDLLINLAFFVYFGTIIPWEQYSSAIIGTSPWRLVVIAILVIFFRRIPIMMALKPIIPDIKTWREALFAGHFGPIGVGAVFVAILARAELETETTTPLADLPKPGFEHLNIIELIWPITTFLVLCSIIVHGSSVAVFTLGRHINTLSLTLSFTKANEEGPSWMDRLPRIQSRSKSSMSLRRPDDTDSSFDEKSPSGLPPIGVPGNFLRRQKEEDSGSRSSSLRPFRRKKWDAGRGPGGPVSQSAIKPAPRNADHSDVPDNAQTDSETIAVTSEEITPESSLNKQKKSRRVELEEEIYQEGDKTVIEDEEGNVLKVTDSKKESPAEREQEAVVEGVEELEEKDVEHDVAHADDEAFMSPIEEIQKATSYVKDATEHPASTWRDMTKKMGTFSGLKRRETGGPSKKPEQKRGPALAYQFGNTIIVEDEDGEVLKKYDIPASRPGPDGRKSSVSAMPFRTRERLNRMSTYLGMGHGQDKEAEVGASTAQNPVQDDDEDKNLRFIISSGGHRMSKNEFIEQIQKLDPKARAKLVENSNAPEALKQEVRQDAREYMARNDHPAPQRVISSQATIQHTADHHDRAAGPDGLALVDSNEEDIPFHPVSDDLARFRFGKGGLETAAQRRRRRAEASGSDEKEEEDREAQRRPLTASSRHSAPATGEYDDEEETAAERRRRQEALGVSSQPASDSSDSEDDDGTGFREPNRPQSRRSVSPDEPRRPEPVHHERGRGPVRAGEQSTMTVSTSQNPTPRTSIRFAESLSRPQTPGQTPRSSATGLRLRWGEDVMQKKGMR
jgi:sodium/hydrogen antiporter